MTGVHPVSEAMRSRIEAELARVEEAEDVVVVYACESGSRAWGFASTDSDYDVRFIYLRPPGWYLSVAKRRDVIEKPITDELDVSGWDLPKALGLFRKGNPPLFEWLGSPIVYQDRHGVAEALREEAKKSFAPPSAFHHYLSMAKKNYKEYLRGEKVRLKKYFYVLRPILAAFYVEAHHQMAPTPFTELLDDRLSSGSVRDEVDQLLEKKRAAQELDAGPRIDALNAYIEASLGELQARAEKVPKGKVPPAKNLDQIWLNALKTCWPDLGGWTKAL
jgi:predicted nucleotidyltransferase